jgi:hypothetical protein
VDGGKVMGTWNVNDLGLESYRISLNIEVSDDNEIDEIVDRFSECLDDLNQTRWSMEAKRDLEAEEKLRYFRNNKAEILSSLPDEMVQEYYDDGGTLPDEYSEFENPKAIIPLIGASKQQFYDDLKEEHWQKKVQERRHLEIVPDPVQKGDDNEES